MKKKIFLSAAFLLLCFLSTSLYAQRGQENTTPETKANKVALHLQSKLGLNDEQKQKIYELNLSTIKDTRALKAAKRNDASGLKTGFAEIHGAYDESLKSILNADQYTNWKKVQKEARDKRHQQLEKETGKKIKINPDQEDPEEEMEWEEIED